MVTVLGWAPLAAVLATDLFASVFGCTVNEGRAHPCVVAGVDFGELLYVGGVSGWFMLVTWPLMLLSLLAWFVLGIRFIMRRVQARRARRVGMNTGQTSI